MNFQNFGNPMLLQQSHQPITVQQLQQLQQLQQQQQAQQQTNQLSGHITAQPGQPIHIQANNFQQLQQQLQAQQQQQPQQQQHILQHGGIQLQNFQQPQQQQLTQPAQQLQQICSPSQSSNLVQTKTGLKDKNKPKNPMSSYACFIQVIREEHRRKHPNEHVDFSEFSKKCAEKWRTMSDVEKKRFDDMAQADRLRFNREMGQYVPPDGIRSKKRKMPKDPNKPKRAWSAFFFFCDEFRPKIREEHPEWRVGDVAKELGKMWENCADKNKYETLAQNARQRYEEEMVQYRAGTFKPNNNALSNNSEGGSGVVVVQGIVDDGSNAIMQNQQHISLGNPSNSSEHSQILHQQLLQQQNASNVKFESTNSNQMQQILIQQQVAQQQMINQMNQPNYASTSVANNINTSSANANNNGGSSGNAQQMQQVIQQQQMMQAAMQMQQQHQISNVTTSNMTMGGAASDAMAASGNSSNTNNIDSINSNL